MGFVMGHCDNGEIFPAGRTILPNQKVFVMWLAAASDFSLSCMFKHHGEPVKLLCPYTLREPRVTRARMEEFVAFHGA